VELEVHEVGVSHTPVWEEVSSGAEERPLFKVVYQRSEDREDREHREHRDWEHYSPFAETRESS
jgi:hypothetical protein